MGHTIDNHSYNSIKTFLWLFATSLENYRWSEIFNCTLLIEKGNGSCLTTWGASIFMVAFNGHESCMGDKTKNLFRTSAPSGMFSQISDRSQWRSCEPGSLMLNPSELCAQIVNLLYSPVALIKTNISPCSCRRYGGNPGWFSSSPALQVLAVWSCMTCAREGDW